MRFIDNGDLKNKRILVRVDFNVSLNPDGTISNDERIKQTLPTLTYLLKNNNTLILMSHLGNPKGVDEKFSLMPIAARLQEYLPNYKIVLRNLEVILSEANSSELYHSTQDNNTIVLLDNLRFNPGEKANDTEFAKQLASLAKVYVNDAFSASHRPHASIVGIPLYLPSFAGFLFKKEVEMLKKAIENPLKPVVAILGGAKISTKLKLIGKFIGIADTVILGGGLAHNFFLAKGLNIGKSISEPSEIEHTKELLKLAKDKNVNLVLPTDVVIQEGELKKINDISDTDQIFDIGVESQAHYSKLILDAKTIIWNGPIGYFEDPRYRHGTGSVFDAIVKNESATSILGGGDTLAAIAGRPGREKITHVSTAGGAMLEFIENGTLPGIEALR